MRSLVYRALMASMFAVLAAIAQVRAEQPSGGVAAGTRPVTVFAAASLKNALDAAIAEYVRTGGPRVVASYAGSSALAKQIENGAPADIFIGADLDWMDELAAKDLILSETRTDLLGNTLVLVAPAASTVSLNIETGAGLAAALGPDGRLAVGDVKAVPAGKYAKASLEKLGLWKSLEARLAQTENVRAALALVARGEVPLGIVYATDAKAEPNVRVVSAIPKSAHPPIVYPMALVRGTPVRQAAQALADYLRSPAAAGIFAAQGFTVLSAGPRT